MSDGCYCGIVAQLVQKYNVTKIILKKEQFVTLPESSRVVPSTTQCNFFFLFPLGGGEVVFSKKKNPRPRTSPKEIKNVRHHKDNVVNVHNAACNRHHRIRPAVARRRGT